MQPRTELTSGPATDAADRIGPQKKQEKDGLKRSLPSLITGVLLASILLLYMVTYQVRFTDVAVVRTFGHVNQTSGIKTAPGLYWKWPWPIQKVDTFDNRLQVTSTVGEENPTKDGKNIIVTTAINWRIAEPYWFSVRCTGMKDAEQKLRQWVRNDQKSVISRYDFSQFVSTDPEELQYDKIGQEIEQAVRARAKEQYGIDVASVQLEVISLPQKITENVFEAMKKERQAVAAKYTSEGESTAQQIKDTAESIAGTIESFADRKSAQIVAEGQRRAAEYNKVFAQDEELASFLILIRNLPQILKDRTTLILDAASAGFWPLLGERPAAAPPAQVAASQPAAAVEASAGDPLPEFIQQR